MVMSVQGLYFVTSFLHVLINRNGSVLMAMMTIWSQGTPSLERQRERGFTRQGTKVINVVV